MRAKTSAVACRLTVGAEPQEGARTMANGGGSAFVKGGFGCRGAFLVIGLAFFLLRGHMQIDAGGACLLFVIGGVIGLIVLAVYKKGYTAGREEERRSDHEHLEHLSDE